MPASYSKEVSLLKSWRESPRKFVKEALVVESISNQQEEALEELRKLIWAKERKYKGYPLTEEEAIYAKKIGISIMSGKGTGKDTYVSWVILYFLVCFKRPLVPCTATTGHQLKDVLWREINKWLKGSKIKDWLTWQSEKVFVTHEKGRDSFAVGRTANPKGTAEEQAETLSGFHEDYMLIVVDEGSGVPEPVFRNLESTLTGPVNIVINIFNPTRSTGFAVESHTKYPDRWIRIHWDSRKSDRVTEEFIDSYRKRYGEDSNAFRIFVKGLPPHSEQDVLIPWDWAMNAVGREVLPLDTDQQILGIDVGAGGDLSVVIPRHGPSVPRILTNNTPDSETLTSWLIRWILDYEPKMVMIDSIGVGWGIAGNLRARLPNVEVIDVNVAEVPSDNERFHRLRDELWWRVRELFEKGIISIPDDQDLISELTTIRYSEPNGKIKVESKKDMKKRGLESPNKADALCLTEYYATETLRQIHAGGSGRNRRESSDLSWRTI